MKDFLKKLWDKTKYIVAGLVTAAATFFVFKARNKQTPNKQIETNCATIEHIKDANSNVDLGIKVIENALSENKISEQQHSDLITEASKLQNEAASQINANKELLK